MKNDPIERKLADLSAIDPASPDGFQQLAKALNDRSNLVVKKAARIAGEAKATDLVAALRKTFDRIFAGVPQSDKGCAALIAISTALVELDYDNPEPFLAGIHHVQMEPVFGPPVDAASDLRAVSAMGLVNTHYPRALEELVTLLADKEWLARAGAIRALAATGSDSAVHLLRYKALMGDEERDVLTECFSALLALSDSNISFVTSRMNVGNEVTAEAAILALSGSRHEAAFDALRTKLKQPRLGPLRKTLLIAIASMRRDDAIEFIKQLAAQEDKDAIEAVRVLRIG